VIGAYYYLKVVKIMYMEEPAPAYTRVREPVEALVMFACAVLVSPIGYLLSGPLVGLAAHAPRSVL
jgi:NADH-quinone oxidoreductase subunit N